MTIVGNGEREITVERSDTEIESLAPISPALMLYSASTYDRGFPQRMTTHPVVTRDR
jgi:hypothetical protein